MSFLYRTLVIAPKTNLSYAEDEVTAVVNLLKANVLQGRDVTADRVLNELTKQYDIIWFATHGDGTGVLLSDGVLTTSELTALTRTANARLIVLNSCSSLEVALQLHNELLTDLVCTIREVPDREAFFTGKQFAIQLSRGLSFNDAYLAAKPGQNRSYLFLSGKDRKQDVVTPEVNKAVVQEASEELYRLIALIDGDRRWNQPGLLHTIKEMDKRIEAIEKAISTMRFVTWMLVVINFLVLIILLAFFFTAR